MDTPLLDDEIDDLLYYARVGDLAEFTSTLNLSSQQHSLSVANFLYAARDKHSGNTALHMAAAHGHPDVLTAIITSISAGGPQNADQVAFVNTQNFAGNTALHWAALNGHLPAVKALIDTGTDPTLTNSAGHDAVYEAELNERSEVVEWVLKASAELETSVGWEGHEDAVKSTHEAGEGMGDEDDDMKEDDVLEPINADKPPPR